MRKNKGTENAIITLCVMIIIACFAGMLALGLGGCMPTDAEEPIPQAESEDDLIPGEQDGTGQSSFALTAPAAGYVYDRGAAQLYIKRYALAPNPAYAYCASWGVGGKTEADCTNFASQVLRQGGLPMQDGGGDQGKGWWYRNSCAWWGSSQSWRQVNRLLQYLVTETSIGEFRQRARDLKVGDLIFYRVRHAEDGYRCDGNLFNHTTVVSGFDARGEPLVSYHSNEALDVPWDRKTGSRGALGEACAIAFVHIRD